MILHVDLNSFYASCAVVKSDGRYTFDTPLMVCGDPRKRHGIVLAATYPVKKTGVRAGMPIWEAMQRCPSAVIAEPDFRAYMDYSERFMRIIRNYSPLIMRYGIDEAYLDYTGCEGLFGTPEQAAHAIRKRVKRELGLTVSVGVGENPIMAKMGSDFKKPDAVTVLDQARWRELIWPLPVGSLMYVGRATQSRLAGMGVTVIGELARLSPELLKATFGKAGGELWLHANGLDNTRITSSTEPQKSISNSVTLPQDLHDRSELVSALLMQTESVAYRLRMAGMLAGLVAVQVRFSDLQFATRQYTFNRPTDITEELFCAIKRILPQMQLDRPIRQVGIRVGRLTDDGEQLSLLDPLHRERLHRLDAAADAMRKKYGEHAVTRCSTLCFDREEFDDFTSFTRI